MMVSTEASEEMLLSLLQKGDVELLVVSSQYHHLVENIGPKLSHLHGAIVMHQVDFQDTKQKFQLFDSHIWLKDGKRTQKESKPNEEIILHSSGTTGPPKLVPLNHKNLLSGDKVSCSYVKRILPFSNNKNYLITCFQQWLPLTIVRKI